MKGIILLASGFEDTEAITTIDILKRAGLEIDLCAVNNEKEITTQYNLKIKPELLIKKVDYTKYDFLVIPGGKAVFNTLSKLDIINDIIKHFNDSGKLIAAICAAPMLLGRNGMFKEKPFTCFPSCEVGIEGIYTGEGVTCKDNYITGKSMAYTIEFALKVVEYLKGKEESEKVRKAVFGM